MMVIRLFTNIEELVKVVFKGELGKGVGRWGKSYGGCWVL
jgi:hypothetical protein